jgi:endonuclease YncB( thermonuclease family)
MPRRLKKRQVKAMIATALGLGLLISQHYGWLDSAKQTAIVNQPGYYHVSKYVDGDTIVVDMNGTPETLRFIGVDTPETHDPRKVVQCYGVVAAAFTNSTIAKQGDRVRLEADPLGTNRDRYGRLLRYIYLPDGTLVNDEIIKQGYGFAYTGFPFTKNEGNKGLWSSCTPTKNQYGGFTSNDAN